MQGLVLLILGAMISSTLAHYGRWENRNVIFDEEEARTPCLISKQVSMHRCDYGTHFNAKCGMRIDCLQGPGEFCSEKMEDDPYGLKCAPGSVCSKKIFKCIAPPYEVDSNDLVEKRLERGIQQVFKGRPLVPTYDY